MFQGNLLAIRTAPAAAAPMVSHEYILAAPGRGLVGDRYALGNGKFSKEQVQPHQEVTLLEAEVLAAVVRDYEITLTHAESRRNLLTQGVPLNHLVGEHFRIGDVLLRGVKLCEPCPYLEGLTQPGVEAAFRHRGGLRAQVIVGGILRCSAEIRADT